MEDGGRPKMCSNELIDNVRNLIEEAPRTSLRILTQKAELSNGIFKI